MEKSFVTVRTKYGNTVTNWTIKFTLSQKNSILYNGMSQICFAAALQCVYFRNIIHIPGVFLLNFSFCSLKMVAKIVLRLLLGYTTLHRSNCCSTAFRWMVRHIYVCMCSLFGMLVDNIKPEHKLKCVHEPNCSFVVQVQVSYVYMSRWVCVCHIQRLESTT